MDIITYNQAKHYLNKGLVGQEILLQDTESIDTINSIGELFDIYCVSLRLKPLAALDFSSYGKKKIKKLNVERINKIINFCNEKNVKFLHINKNNGMYLKSIFFLEENISNAIKLMYHLWIKCEYLDYSYYHFVNGYLLGYDLFNIKFFIKKNYDIELSEDDLYTLQTLCELNDYTLEDLKQSEHKIILKDRIKTI